MIRFKVFHQGRQAPPLPLETVHLFGQDEIPVRGEFQYENGELLGIRHNDSAVGLATLWEVKGFGKLSLQTTRLPVRDQFYNLNVEIARSRLLRISQKREEWGLTDLTMTAQEHELIDKAMDQFIEALCHLDDPAKASQYADASLLYSMQMGESLAMSHAKLFLERRILTSGFRKENFGCIFDPSRIRDKQYLKLIKDHFQFVTVPLTWHTVQPKEQEWHFEQLDECLRWLSRNRIVVKMGPLLSCDPETIPDWVFIWENDFEQVRELAYEYITAVVSRFEGKVQAWDVVSGFNANNCFRFGFEQMIEMTRSATLAAKRASKQAVVLVELTQLWGEYYSSNPRTIPPLLYADAVCQGGIPFDGFSLKMPFGGGPEGMRARDLLELSVLLDRFAGFGKSVHLSGVGAPSRPSDPGTGNKNNGGSPGEMGYWHEEWSDGIQAQWLNHFYEIALSKPFVESVTWGDLTDRGEAVGQKPPPGEAPWSGLLHADYKPKPAFEAYLKLKKSCLKREKKT